MGVMGSHSPACRLRCRSIRLLCLPALSAQVELGHGPQSQPFGDGLLQYRGWHGFLQV